MKKRGSFTIEAALVVPMLFIVILLLIHISFFLYNRQAATAIASRGVLKGVQMETEGKASIKQEVQSFLDKEVKEKLIFVKNVDCRVDVSVTKVKVRITIVQKIPFRDLSCEVKQEMSRIHPVSFLWEMERLKK